MRIDFHPEAAREVVQAQTWYEERSALAAQAFLRELSSVIRRIQRMPRLYPVALAGTRSARMERFPFGVYYRELSDRLQVVAVGHLKRKPGYWSDR